MTTERARVREKEGVERDEGRRTRKRHDRQLICTYIRHPRGNPIQLSALMYNVRRLCRHGIVPIYLYDPSRGNRIRARIAFLWNLLLRTVKLLGWKNVILGTKEIANWRIHRGMSAWRCNSRLGESNEKSS